MLLNIIIALSALVFGFCYGFARGHEDGHSCEKFNNLMNKGMFDE